MYVNTKIVKALLELRALSLQQLAEVTGISRTALATWLEGSAQENDARLPFERQLEVLKVLGIAGDHPRADVTHNWYLREPLFGDRAQAYEPLRLMLLCFGRCEVTHLAPKDDPLINLRAVTHFGLTFEKFRAVLAVSSSALRSLAFDPSALPNMVWVGDDAPLFVQASTFLLLTLPGEAMPVDLDQARFKAQEHVHWAKLALLAEERGMGATELARYLITHVPPKPALEHKPKERAPSPSRLPAAVSNELFFNANAAAGPRP